METTRSEETPLDPENEREFLAVLDFSLKMAHDLIHYCKYAPYLRGPGMCLLLALASFGTAAVDQLDAEEVGVRLKAGPPGARGRSQTNPQS